MGKLEKRIEKLENAPGGPGVCECQPRRLVIIYPDGSQVGPDVCPDCGRPALRVVVKYEVEQTERVG